MRALALEHLHSNPIGVYGDVLEERGIGVDRVRLDQLEPLPDWRDYDLLVVMGGGMSVYEEQAHPWLVDERRLIQEAVSAGMPYFGVCLGSQLLAAALGARVFRGPEPELGVNPVFLCEEARRDPVFRGFPLDLEVFEWHADTFDLPERAVRLARSPRYENQAFRIGPVAYAIQCHLETTIDDVHDWFAAWPSLVEIFEDRYGGGSLDSFLEEYAASMPYLRQTARQLFRRWLENAFVHRRPTRRPSFRASAPVDESLLSREREQTRIALLLGAARERRSGALVLVGETGIGKTALLDETAARAEGMRVLRLAGIESELEHPLAGFEALCRPLLDRLGSLPQRQGRALAGALGIGPPARGDRFDAYAGALSLLAAAAEREPLLVCVDDAHLLDHASLEAMGFIVDRIEAEGIALLVASATGSVVDTPEVEVVELGPLDRSSAWLLLERRFGRELSPHVAAEVIDAARGNPLALLEISASLASDQRSGAAPLAEVLRTRGSAEQALLARISALPDQTRRALLVAALSETDDLAAVERALRVAGLDASALAVAAQEGLIALTGECVAFRHGLVSSTVIYGALRSERRRAHAALAQASESDPGSDAAAWHGALAASASDEGIAASLTEVAQRAGVRGAPAAAARAYELAARLSPSPKTRARRLLRAAEAASLAGHIYAAVDHLEAALPELEDTDERLAAERLLGRVLARSGSAGRARDVLVAAASRSEVSDHVRAASFLAEAVIPALRAGAPTEAREIGGRALTLTEGMGGLPELTAALMLGTALVYTGDFSSGRELVLRAAALAADEDGFDRDLQLRVYLGAGLRLAGEHDRAREVLTAFLDDARAEGSVGVLAYALVRLGEVELDAGRWSSARALLADASRLARETGQAADRGLAAGGLAWLAALQGRREECDERAAEAIELAERLGVGSRLNRAIHARGLLALATGDAEEAVHHLSEMRRLQLEQGWCDAATQPHGAPDLIEALVAAGSLDMARREIAVFEEETRRAGRPSSFAAALRSRALFAKAEESWACFEDALRIDEKVTGPFERARTELAYGQRLAEEDIAPRAEGMLGAALEHFAALGAEPWAARTREAIRRLGAKVPEPENGLLDRLTDRELQVALGVGSGETVHGAAVRLLLTVPTVERNLASALSKLELSSPDELSAVMTRPPARALA
jgi:GMP synthase-like glutamine amidotransferase/tetratricopeptide (TPR) repeat protein